MFGDWDQATRQKKIHQTTVYLEHTNSFLEVAASRPQWRTPLLCRRLSRLVGRKRRYGPGGCGPGREGSKNGLSSVEGPGNFSVKPKNQLAGFSDSNGPQNLQDALLLWPAGVLK